MENISLKQTRVSVGCRITLEKKNELLIKAKENGFASLSQYLEVLILRALNSEIEQELKPEPKLTDKDFEIIEQRLSNALNKQKTPTQQFNPEKRLDEVLTSLSILCGGSDQKTHNHFIQTLKKKDLKLEELIEQVVSIGDFEDMAVEDAIKNLLPIQLSSSSKGLIINYFNYLITNKIAYSGESALIGVIHLAFERGGILDGLMPGDKEYSLLFKKQNTKLISNNR